MTAGRPMLSFPPELLLSARGTGDGIAAAIFDVDGVLTDGRVYIGEDGEVFKAFSTLDGQGMKLLGQGGIVPIVVTGRDSAAVRRRVAELGLAHAAYGAADKLAAAETLLAGLGLGWDRVAVMGDDWPDLPLMARAAFACAPPNGHVEVRAAAHHVTTTYATGVKIPDAVMATLNLQPHEVCPQWNYTIHPRPTVAPSHQDGEVVLL